MMGRGLGPLDLLGRQPHLAAARDALARLHVRRDGVALARPQRAAPVAAHVIVDHARERHLCIHAVHVPYT